MPQLQASTLKYRESHQMTTSTPSSITIDEALARIINMDYIPKGFTLKEMLLAFQEEAEIEYENSRLEGLPQEQMAALELRRDACKARYELYVSLKKDLENEVDNPEQSEISISRDSSGVIRLTPDSVFYWSAIKYGIGITECIPDKDTLLPDGITWEDITVKIRAGHRIAYSHKKGKWSEKTFADIGLLNKRTNEPNHQGGILIGLSHGKKFPESISPKAVNKDKAAISKLRTSLLVLTGITDDPFTVFNQQDGWKPRFKLLDDRKNADERAKREAASVAYDDSLNYEQEDDDTDKWLLDNE
jgi:hypothetical protein